MYQPIFVQAISDNFMKPNVPEAEHCKNGVKIRATRDTNFHALVFDIVYVTRRCIKLADVFGDALTLSWPTLVWRGHRPREGGRCVRAQ